jgi:hypothetical protein
LAKRPTYGGLPIPYIVAIDRNTGRPMFALNNEMTKLECLRERLCAQCGQPFMGQVCFIGSDEEVELGTFLEPPMHEDCGRYALAICPYLVNPGYVPRKPKVTDPKFVKWPGSPDPPPRPQKMGLVIARNYEVISNGQLVAVRALQVKRVQWF